jgi:DNA-binding transcriptional regulator YiaG
MAYIQKIIIERLKVLIRKEIRTHWRTKNDEDRNIRGDVAECKDRLTKLEKKAETECENMGANLFDCIRASETTLKALQKKLGVSQKELAVLLDTNPATVNRWEAGKVKLSRKSCAKIAKLRSLSKSEAQQTLREKTKIDMANEKQN